jgi:hypothetical protein
MRNVTLKNSLYLLIGVSAIAWCLLAYFNNLDLSKVKDFFGLVPKVVSFDLLVITVFVKWGWKFKVFRGWLVPFPNLQGSWSGEIYSDWINPETREKVPPIPVLLTINQSFFHISCKMMTGEMDSFSTAEGFNIDPDRQIKQLAYIYTSRPRISVSQRSIFHDGSIVFDIVEKPDQKLKGRYWTERKTTGEIVLKKHSEDLLEDLPEEFTQHPVTEKENLR